MRAARVVRFDDGDPLAALEVADGAEPQRPDGWETVELRAAALNGHDLWSLRGVGLTEADLPRVLGSDGAGVTATGREVVIHPVISDHPVETADALDARTAPLLSERHDGTLAHRVVVPAHCLLDKPAHLTFAEAAALPTAWLTAYRMLFSLSATRPGDTVLVQGAGGGVSTALVALGAAAGLRMWVTGRSEAGRALATELGAEAAYEPGVRLPDRVDAVMETVGEPTWDHSLRCLRVGGTLVVAGATGGAEPSADLRRVFFHQLRIVGTRVGDLSEMRGLLDLVRTAGLRPTIDSTHTLDDVATGLRRLDVGGVLGKVVVTP